MAGRKYYRLKYYVYTQYYRDVKYFAGAHNHVQAYFTNRPYIVATVRILHNFYIHYIHIVYNAMFIVIVSRV